MIKDNRNEIIIKLREKLKNKMNRKEIDLIAREIDATLEGCFAMGFHLDDRAEIISELLMEKFGIDESNDCSKCSEGCECKT